MAMPSKKQIIYYWEQFLVENDRFIPNDYDYCWACGSIHKIQRCHLIAKSENGSDKVDNIILLCADCHNKTENFSAIHTFNYILSTEFIDWWDHLEKISCRRFGYEIKNIDVFRSEQNIAMKKVIPILVKKYKKSQQEIMQDETIKNELVNRVYELIKVGPNNKNSEKYINALHLKLK